MKKRFILILLILFILSLSTVSAEGDFTDTQLNTTVEEGEGQNYYVSPLGSDDNVGNSSSPFATINMAISSSDNSTIFLSDGIFTGTGNSALTINGKTITIIGAGIDKTIVDLSSKQFLNIGSTSSIQLINLTITNGVSTTKGGAIISTGSLTVDTVKFLKNSAKQMGGAIHSNQNTIILNSQFINCDNTMTIGKGGSVYIAGNAKKNAIIDNCVFINSTSVTQGGALWTSYTTITNNIFENCKITKNTGTGGAIYGSYLTVNNNTFTDCTAASGKGNEMHITGAANAFVTVIGNSTINITDTTFNLDARVTDDMGNQIHGLSVSFYFNDTLIGSGRGDNGILSGTFTKFLNNGAYICTAGGNTLLDGSVIKPGMVNYQLNNTYVEIYVSPVSGNDTSGNGSRNNPYRTIKKAITEGFADNKMFVNIHLLGGIYNGTDNTNLVLSNMGSLNIIGEEANVIFDGNNTTSQAFNFGSQLTVSLSNITFTNFSATNYDNLLKSDDYIIICQNCTFINNNYKYDLISSINLELYDVKIINNTFSGISSISKCDNLLFENNTAGGLSFNNAILTNSSFINNNKTGSSLITTYSGIVSENNKFLNNSGLTIFSTSTHNSESTLISKNDKFINNSGNNGVVLYGGATFINGTFINNTANGLGGVIYHTCHNLTIENCTFVNNTANDGDDVFTNKQFIVYDEGGNRYPALLTTPYTLTFVDINSTTSQINLKAELDMAGIQFSGLLVDFYLNDEYMDSAQLVNSVATLSVRGIPNGIYNITGKIQGAYDSNIVSGILNVSINASNVFDVYVSEYGNDITGNGSKDNPFATIRHAFDYAMSQDILSIKIHIIGTIKGEGNVLLDLEPDVNLTIVGENQKTSIWDVENYTKAVYFKPTSLWVNVEIMNITIRNGIGIAKSQTGAFPSNAGGIIQSYGKNMIVDNCIFENTTGFSLSVNKLDKAIGSILINNTAFNNVGGAFFTSRSALNITVLNSNFTRCNLRENLSLIYISDAYLDFSMLNHIDIYTKFLMDNCIFDGNWFGEYNPSVKSLLMLKLFNGVINNTFFINNKNVSSIDIPYESGFPRDGTTYLNIVNSYFNNNSMDVEYSVRVMPINIINTTFENSGGFDRFYDIPSVRYTETSFNIFNSSFINMSSVQIGIYPRYTSSYDTLNQIHSSQFINSVLEIGRANVVDSAFYNTTVEVTSNATSLPIYLNNNYWDNLLPNYTIKGPLITYCDYWIVPVLTTDNASGPTQVITLNYKLFDGGKFREYDVSNVPISDEDYVISVSDGIITPTSGVLTKNKVLTFNYTYGGLGNQTVTAILGNGIILELNATFYKTETQLNLTIDSEEVHVGDNLTVNLVLADKDDKLINGSVDIYLNSVFIDTINVTDGKGVLSIVMDKNPMVYEIFANYTGNEYYQSSVNASVFTLLKTDMDVSVKNNNSKDNVTFDISFNYPANGTVEVTINNKNYTAPVKDGACEIIIPPMDVGNYEALVSYNGVVNQTVPFNVARDNKTNIKAEDIIMYYKDGTLFNVTLTDAYGDALVNESVIINLNGSNCTKTTNDEGIASFEIDLATGNYTASVYYLGNTNQDPASTTAKISVLTDTSTVIIVDDLVMYYKNGSRLSITLTDALGNLLVNESVIINLNGVNYTRITNDKGVASIAINLNVGNYTTNIYYNGSNVQDKANTTASITVLSTIYGKDIVKIYKNGTQYYATFVDGQGNYLAHGTEVTFNINGVMYKRYINGSEGRARLNINLNPSEYILTAINPITNEMSSNLITVLAQITENNDLVKYFRNDSQYRVKVLDKDGKAVGANETVVFNINGVMYKRLTDAEGYAQLRINLDPGTYTITAMYGDSMVSNEITVLPIITASDLTKKYGVPGQFKANLVDGQGKPIVGQNVTFNINGVFYDRLTDGNGTAALNINLIPGVYIITSSYGAASTGNTVTVIE